MDPLGTSEGLGLDPGSSESIGHHLNDPSLQLTNHGTITDSSVMLQPPSSDLDHEMLGFYSSDDPHHGFQDEMLPVDNGINASNTDSQNFGMMNNAADLGLAHHDSGNVSLDPQTSTGVNGFEGDERFLFEENMGSSTNTVTDSSTAKCEYCGTLGLYNSFYSKSKRFCKMECSKKYSALFQKKGNSNRSGGLGSARGHKRKIARSHERLKKPKVELVEESTSQLSTLESSLEQVSINEFQTTDLKDETQDTYFDESSVTIQDKPSGSWIDQDFNWKDYLQATGEKPASERLFKHIVKAPILTDSHIGMKVEVINDHSDANKETNILYWIATVVGVDTNLLLLRYCGQDDETQDFWFDIRSKHIHPVGWCYKVRRPLLPPPELRTIQRDWQKFVFQELSGTRTLSSDFIEKVKKGHYNKFEVGSKVEVCDKRNLLSMCVATIIDIVGDRLRLRYDGLEDEPSDDYWSHFLSSDIHPVGWSQLVGHTLSPPFGWRGSLTEWNEFLAEDLHDSNDAAQECFVPESMGTPPSDTGCFEVGMKLEALDPRNPLCMNVASVMKILQFNYFVVGLDSQETQFICHSSSSNIFPVGWAKQHKIFLTPPKEFAGKTFDWNKYLLKTESVAAPAHLFAHLKKRITPFEIGTKVEAVDLREPSFICPATVVAVHGTLLRIHFDGWDSTFDQWVNNESLDLFPVAWCEKNTHPLQPPGSLLPDPVLDQLRQRKSSTLSQRRTAGHGRVGRPPGSLNKNPSAKSGSAKAFSGKGKGGKAGAKHGKVKKTSSTFGGGGAFEKQRFGNFREMRKGGEVQFAFNQECACGPFLNPEEVRSIPNYVRGYLNGPPHQNCIRQSLHAIVNAAHDPNQLLELFSSEFYQSKKHKDLKLDNTICLEITGKNGKRFLRRVRGPSRSGILGKYMNLICKMLQCCPNFVSEERSAGGKCQTNCHEIYNDGGSMMESIMRHEQFTPALLNEDSILLEEESKIEDGKSFTPLPPADNVNTSNAMVTSSTSQAPLDSPCDPSSSSQDRGIDPLNLLDQEFLSSKDPREWSVQEVMDFMTAIGCPAHAPSFQKQEIDGKALFLLSFDELESLTENKLGPITKLKDALQSLKKMWQITTPSSS